MQDDEKTRPQLISELALLRQRLNQCAEVESEEGLSRIMEGTSVPTFVIDNFHVVTYWNKACENLTGIPADEIIGTNRQWAAFYSSERPVMADLVVDVASREEIPRYYRGMHRISAVIEGAHEAEDFFPEIGERGKWLFFTAAPLKDTEGTIIGAIETLQDITERKLAEEALAAEKDRAQKYLDVAAVMILVLDTERRIVLINKRGCGILGYEEHELIDKNWFEMCVPQRNRKRASFFFDRIMAGKIDESEYFETPILTKNGEERIMAWHNAVLKGESDRITGVLRSGEDLTERKLAEEKSYEAETLRELDRLRNELLANVSHELRTPLTVIKASSSMLIRCDDMLESEEKIQHLESIERSADSLAELVDNLLDMSRLETGMLKMERSPVNISELLGEAEADSQVRIPSHSLIWNIPDSLPVMFIDRRRIRQVVDNLIENATKYSETGTDVTVSVRFEEDQMSISVSDQGMGIPAQDLEMVFERLYRVRERSSQQVSGIGLGLAISKGIVEAHGGRIWIESEPEKGSTCFFTLPKELESNHISEP